MYPTQLQNKTTKFIKIHIKLSPGHIYVTQKIYISLGSLLQRKCQILQPWLKNLSNVMAHDRFNVLTTSNITEPKFFIEKVKEVKKNIYEGE